MANKLDAEISVYAARPYSFFKEEMEKLDVKENIVLGHDALLFRGFERSGPSITTFVDCKLATQNYKKDMSNNHSFELELQNNPHRENEDYHNIYLAKDKNSKLVGILYCPWYKDDETPFWRYKLEVLDVHEDYMGKGIEETLLSMLNEDVFHTAIELSPTLPKNVNYDVLSERNLLIKSREYQASEALLK